MTIQAKPTRYRDILFQSRLEASWAVFLDSYALCRDWIYHPITIVSRESGWKYTPDFFIVTSLGLSFYLEVKPIRPNADYLINLRKSAQIVYDRHGSTLKIGYGHFFLRSVPRISTIKLGKGPVRLTPKPLDTSEEFPDASKALNKTRSFRFDL